MKRIAIPLTAAVLAATLMTSVHAADVSYSEWKGSETVATTDELVERLNTLIDTAERQRAADPLFLQDLRDALAAYQGSQTPLFIKDNFGDGDISRNPAWTIASGKFGLEKNGGLRSIVALGGYNPQGGNQNSKQNTASAILDNILGSGKSGGAGSNLVSSQRAEVYTGAKITNTFLVSTLIRSRGVPGQFDWTVYQGGDRSSGYRLSYFADATTPSFELSRFNRKGSSVIDSFDAPRGLEDGNPHKINWTRAAGGAMSVTLDGGEILNVTDQGIKSGFDGLAMANAGGDFTVKDVEVRGVR